MTTLFRISKKLLFFCIIYFILINHQNILNAQNIQPLPQGVSIHQLDNGMQVLLIENPALPMVGVNVVVKVGSAYESFSTSGMSHMLEHLLFNGTTSRTQKELYDETDLIGGYNNANTSDFYTNYMMVTPSEDIEKGMELQADMLFNSILPEKKFEKEKGIVLEEIAKSLGNPSEQIERNIISILYPNHALSLPTLGTYATIESMKRDDVWNFYKNNYVPNNMLMSVIGNFQSSDILEKIANIYGKAKPGLVQRESSKEWAMGFNNLPKIQKENLFFRFYNGENVQVSLFYKMDTNQEYTGLIDLALEKKQDDIKTSLQSLYKDQIKNIDWSLRSTPIINYLQINLTLVDASNLNGIKESFENLAKKIDFSLSNSVLEAEIANAQTNFLKNIEKPHMFGIYNAYSFAAGGIEKVLASYSAMNINKASQFLSNFKIGGDPLIIIQNPSAKNATSKLNKSTEALLFEAKDGMADIIVVTNPSSNLLAVHYMIKHKAELESKYGKNAATILHNCIEQRFKSEEIQNLTNKYGLTYVFNDNPFIPMDNIYLHPDFGYIRVEGLAQYTSDIINFLNQQLLNFRPTEEEFEKASGKFKSAGPMMMGRNKAKELFTKKYESVIYNPEKYPQELKLDYENLLKFTEAYLVPSNMIISIVSPVEQNTISNLFKQYKKDITNLSNPAYQRELKIQTENVNIEENVGGEQSYLYWGFSKKIEVKDKPALQALSLILSDKIIFDIREKQGMAYRMSAGIKMVKDKTIFYINMGTRPQNVDTLLPQFPNFFTTRMIENITNQELEKSINMYLGRMKFRRLSSINQGYYLAHSLYFNNDINYDNNFHEQLKGIKVQDVINVAQKYMQIANPVSVVIR